MQELKHWRLEREPAGLAWLIFDKAGESTNTLSAEAMRELGLVLDELDREPPKALVIRSGKSAGFIAGADIEEFTKIDSPEGARARPPACAPARRRSLSADRSSGAA